MIDKQTIEDVAIKNVIDRYGKPADEPWSEADEKECVAFVAGAVWMQNKSVNHHHELTDKHEIVDFGDGGFVANKEAIPLLKALHEAGLRTRTHHITEGENHCFISILLDNVQLEIKTVNEKDANRITYNGRPELLIKWDK